MAPLCIGLIGAAGAGKSTVADAMQAHYGFERVSLAQPLKHIVGQVFDLKHDQMYTLEGKETLDPRWGKTPREILQHVGTEGFRAVHPDVWIRMFERTVEVKLGDGVSVVCDDVRFPNEADTIRRIGGEVWKVVKIGGPVTAASSHASETALDCYPVDRVAGAEHGRTDVLIGELYTAMLAHGRHPRS